MAANVSEAIYHEVAELRTSIKYHDWFLGFVVVVGVSLTVYLVGAMNSLQDGLHGVRMEVQQIRQGQQEMRQDIQEIRQDIQEIRQDIQELHLRFDSLEGKVDEYHGRGNASNL